MVLGRPLQFVNGPLARERDSPSLANQQAKARLSRRERLTFSEIPTSKQSRRVVVQSSGGAACVIRRKRVSVGCNR